MFKTQQADTEIHEDQLLNFLVNSLDEEVALNLATNATIDTEDIYEVLDLYVVQLQRRLAIGEHDSLPSTNEVRAETIRTGG